MEAAKSILSILVKSPVLIQFLFFISTINTATLPSLERYRSIRVVILRSFARITSNLSLTRSNLDSVADWSFFSFFSFFYYYAFPEERGEGKGGHENLDRHSKFSMFPCFEFLYLLKYRSKYRLEENSFFICLSEGIWENLMGLKKVKKERFKNVGGNNEFEMKFLELKIQA